MAFQKETLVLGGGACADLVADQLSTWGIAVLRATLVGTSGGDETRNYDRNADIHHDRATMISCRGQAGNFRVTLAINERRYVHTVSSIVLAQPCIRIPNYDFYALPSSDRVISISALETMTMENGVHGLLSDKTHVVFLNSWQIDPHPVMAQTMLQWCLAVQQQPEVNTYFLCGNLKVSIDGMEARCETAKRAGTLILKFTGRFPVLTPLADGRIRIDYRDETTGMDGWVVADLVVVDERIIPPPQLAEAIRQLRLASEADGFAQTDNIHRLPNLTNRRGIFVAGGARAVLPDAALAADAQQVALKVLEFISGEDRGPLPRLEIDQDSCARCLTCYRLCPYAAIETTPHMHIQPEACQSCGLCFAACPNRAILMHDEDLEKALACLALPGESVGRGDGFVPRIVAFCCSRSAAQARKTAESIGSPLPAGLVCVEGICGGTFSVRHLLSAVEAGVDGVLVLSCHEGNCHSERGTLEAQKRVAEAIHLLSWAGITEERVQFATLAANMSSEFVRMIGDFAEKIKALGPAMKI